MSKKKITKRVVQSSFFTSPRWAYVGSFLLSVVLIWLSFRFQHHLEHSRSLGLLGIFLINLVSSFTIVLPTPGIASIILGGRIYSPLLVGIAAALGGALGNMLAYFLGRAGKHVVLNHSEFSWYNWLHDKFHRYAALLIFLFAFIPNPFFDAIAIIAGIAEYSPIRFFALILAARLLRDTLLAFLGAKL